MSISSTLDQLHFRARENKWLQYFAVFNRIGLAAGFIPSGLVKIMGERFTSLSALHPMGHYLEAFHRTGFYYPFVGIMQVIAAILLLIRRTTTLGAVIYFPIILNICILSIAVRFEGSLFSSPLMVLANLYLLCWDYHKLKFLLPFYHHATRQLLPKTTSKKFPTLFFAGVLATVIIVVLLTVGADFIRPRNTLFDCREQFKGSVRTKAGYNFCDCIHRSGQPLNKCLEEYYKAPNDTIKTP